MAEQSRILRIEGVLETAPAMAHARNDCGGNDRAFGRWCTDNKINCKKNERAALVGMGRLDQASLRGALERTTSRSIRVFWQQLQPHVAFPIVGKGPDLTDAQISPIIN